MVLFEIMSEADASGDFAGTLGDYGVSLGAGGVVVGSVGLKRMNDVTVFEHGVNSLTV